MKGVIVMFLVCSRCLVFVVIFIELGLFLWM